jgi:hypothetical protein
VRRPAEEEEDDSAKEYQSDLHDAPLPAVRCRAEVRYEEEEDDS